MRVRHDLFRLLKDVETSRCLCVCARGGGDLALIKQNEVCALTVNMQYIVQRFESPCPR